MITKRILGEDYTFDPSKDAILKHGVVVRYYHSNNPEDKVVLNEFVFWSARFQTEIIIPRWFVCDQGSVPYTFRSIVSKAGPMEYASLPHDFGYTISVYHPHKINLKRKDWDLILKDFLAQQGMGGRRQWYSYLAVRAGGNTSYDDAGKMFFCPDWNKRWYREEYDFLNIPFENGEYKII